MSFDNCSQAYEAGYSNIPSSSPLYARKLDRDRDGVACDNPPAGFKPRQDAEPTKTTSGAGSDSGQSTSTGTTPQLPTTGPGEVTAVGGLLLLVGVAIAVAVRRRKTSFTA